MNITHSMPYRSDLSEPKIFALWSEFQEQSPDSYGALLKLVATEYNSDDKVWDTIQGEIAAFLRFRFSHKDTTYEMRVLFDMHKYWVAKIAKL